MKVMTLSNRFYYRELDEDVRNTIKHDLKTYNSMLHTAYKLLYDKKYKNAEISKSLQIFLKEKYHTSDYMPLSAINEARSLLKSQKAQNRRLLKQSKRRQDRIRRKINELEKELSRWREKKETLIERCRVHDYGEKEYLYESQTVDPKIRELKNRIKLIRCRLGREKQKHDRLKNKVGSACFGDRRALVNRDIEAYRMSRSRRMLICGRRQGKYSNNLFKYHIEEKMMVYRGIEKEIMLPVEFHHNSEILERSVRMKNNTPGKAVAYELYDHGEYFIIKAIMEYMPEPCITSTEEGVIGVDMNIDHIALSETDRNGNLIHMETYPMHQRKKTGQRRAERYEVVKKITERCVERRKSLIIESLDFEARKQESVYGDKRKNQILSEFSYAQLSEMIERSCAVRRVEVRKTDPAYTTQIGKLKYSKRLGIDIHHAASYVTARRGMGYEERVPNEYMEFRNKQTRKEQWKEVVRILGKATLRECQFTPYISMFR